jgi:hypothetical protein
MDFRQSKLSKNEWISIEKPVDLKEKNVLDMIVKGYLVPDYKIHLHHVISEVVKLEHSEKDYYIYIHILKERIDKLIKLFKLSTIESIVPKKKLNGADTIRIQSYRKKQLDNIEFMLLDMIEKFFIHFDKKKEYYFYNICILYKKFIINKYLTKWIEIFIIKYNDSMDVITFLENTSKYIENNSIFDYKPLELYEHQKQIYKCVKDPSPKLIFYRAPTSSGKTLTPLGLCEENKVIFICASRHIGINLAKSAVNVGRKVGFAFGCTTTEDVRLHYFSVKTFITERGRKRPDHSDGANLEMLICDIQSYEIAMLYMLSFFENSKIILFWDEPTISMNYQTHDLHKYIVNIWEFNQIQNIILSSATLPNEEDLSIIILKFKSKYNGLVHYIETQDENTNITLLAPDGNIIMPHDIFDTDYNGLNTFILKHSYTHSKYLSISECSDFLLYIYRNVFKTHINSDITIQNITNNTIRELYYKSCQRIKSSEWNFIIAAYKGHKKFNKFNLGDEITTKYSHTLTYGPTIYLCENLDKWINYFVENSGIHQAVFKELEKNIDFNNDIIDKVNKKKKILEDRTIKDEQNENKMKDQRFDPVTKQMIEEIEGLERSFKEIQLNPLYIPNTRPHYDKWANTKVKYEHSNVFTGDVDETCVRKIMNLSIDTNYKILLLMGIGVFTMGSSELKLDDYNDIMKELADQKKLLFMIAGSEYINGTNFQFDHGYLADDIININQETIIQAIGRVGRKEKNKTFTFRFRDSSVIKSLFIKDNHTESMNLNRLFF